VPVPVAAMLWGVSDIDDAQITPTPTPEASAAGGSGSPAPERWVVGIDGSDHSLHALGWAVARARDAVARGVGVRISAFTAWRMPSMAPFGVGGTTMMVHWDDLEAGARQRLDTAIDAVDTSGVDVETVVVQGGASGALVEASGDAALLIVGSRGHSALRDLVLGSVSRQCCTHATVPVVVVPGDVDLSSPERVVVGFDVSERSAAAVRWALGPGASLIGRARLEALGAFDRSPFEEAELTRERFGDEVEDAEATFHRGLDELDPDHRMARVFSLAGARRALASAVEPSGGPHAAGGLEPAPGPADLVVLGARGRGAIGSALLGSVSNWMLHQLQCPTVIVPS